ncbi:AmmeMemoRadiSam system protein B [Lentisphaerota bacterium ZTH]|nr:AmmeMemoRadiSam system protein B [Lentisphaerota bacterium]WET06537.1 AmmeMemoRadiSam system protein B [Lentisphaerota bacterium ZTH]
MKYFLCFIFVICLSGQVMAKTIDSHIAGHWYPSDPEKLRKQIKSFVDNSDAKIIKGVNGLILPHAGYKYSGRIAGAAIKQIMGKKFKRVIILGPSHRHPITDKICIPDVKFFNTPLGKVQVDSETVAALRKNEFVEIDKAPHEVDHSIHIELPMLQYALKDFKLVPILVGRLSWDTVVKVAQEMIKVADKDTLLVFSADFTHYGKRFNYTPFGNDFLTRRRIKQLDLTAFTFLEERDGEGLIGFIERTGATICGRDTLAVAAQMMGSNTNLSMLSYGTSAEVSGSLECCVSYISAAFSGGWKVPNKKIDPPESIQDIMISDKEKIMLLGLARQAIGFSLEKNHSPTLEDLNFTPTSKLKEKRAVFVTIRQNDKLKGCMGELYPTRPLYASVVHQAINAAFLDSRFLPLTRTSQEGYIIEISILTAPQVINSWKKIELGKDGIILKKNNRRSVFLPQVPIEQGWDLPETLTHLSMKAGLPPYSWKKNTTFEVFQTIRFRDKTGDVE